MPPSTTSVELPALQLRAEFLPDSVDEANRTVDLVIATSAPIRMYDWQRHEWVVQELSIDEDSIRTARLDKGLVLLWDHNRWGMRSILGRSIKWWIKNEQLFVRARISDTHEDAELAWKMILSGDLTDTSCGYKVFRSEEIEGDFEDGIKRMRAIDWEVFEGTLTPIGADVDTGTRSLKGDEMTTCVISRAEQAPAHDMNKKAKAKPNAGAPVSDAQRSEPAQTAPPEPAPATPAEPTSQRSEPSPAPEPTVTPEPEEYRHASEVLDICAEQGLDAGFARGLIGRTLTPEQARSAVSDQLATMSERNEISSHVRVGESDLEKRSLAVGNALDHRVNPSGSELNDGGRQYRGLRMLEIGREFLERRGINTRGMGTIELAERALHVGSDLANVIGAVANRTLRAGHDKASQSFMRWARQVTLPDFRATERVQFGGLGLQKLNEKGEIKSGKLSDGKTAIKLESFGEKIGYTRQMFINDDMDALGRIPLMWGNAKARLENSMVYALVTGNAMTGDGKALFDASHKNTGSGVINVAGLSTGRTKMALHPAFGNKEAMNLQPGILLVPSALQTVAQQQVATGFVPGSSGEVNPFAGNLEVISEALLDADSALKWYLIVANGQYDTVEYGYLEGSNGLDLRVKEGFDIDGIELRVTHDFGVALMGHEGFYRSTGA